MATLKMRACLVAAQSISDADRDAVLERAEQYERDGIEANKAARMAAADVLAEMERDRAEFEALAKEQFPQAFAKPEPAVDRRAAKARARAKARMALNPETDSMLEALAKMGGIRRDIMAGEFGMKPEELKFMVLVGGLRQGPFRATGGMDLDTALTSLQEAGYFTGVADEDIRTTFEEAAFAEIGGDRRLTPQGIAFQASREADERAAEVPEDPFDPINTAPSIDDFTADELEQSGYAEADPEVKAAAQALLAEAESLGIDTEALREDAAKGIEDQSEDFYYARLQAITREAIASARRATGGPDAEAARGSAEDRGQAAGDEGGQEEGLTLEDRLANVRAEADKWLRTDAEYEGRDFSAEYLTLARQWNKGSINASQYISNAEALLADYMAARKRFFAPMAEAAKASEEANRRAAARTDNRTPAQRNFDRSPEQALNELDDETLDQIASALGVRRGGRTRMGYIEAITSNPISQVRAAFNDATAEPLLAAQSAEDLKAKTDREAATAEADKREQKRLADKAKADAQRDEFTLTGSDRAVDLAAAAGQGGLFDAPAPSPAPAPAAGDLFGARTSDLDAAKRTLEEKRRALIDLENRIIGMAGVGPDLLEAALASRKVPKAMKDQRDALRAEMADLRAQIARLEAPANQEPVKNETRANAGAAADGGGKAGSASKKSDRLTDAGEELIRNRRGKLKGLAWDDVSAMNDTLKVAQVIKSNVWPRPDYAKMVEDGAPAWKAAALKAVYDKLAAAPATRKTPTNDDLREYIETMQAVREALMAELDRVEALSGERSGQDLWKTLDAKNVFGKVFPLPTDARATFGRPSHFDRSSEQGKANNRRALLIGGNGPVDAMQFSYRFMGKVKDLLAEGFPAKQEAWQKSWEVRQTETRANDVPEAERTGEPQQRFYVYEKGSRWRLAKGQQDGGYGTQELAEAFARSLVQKKRETLPPSRGLDLADVKRTGPDWRKGRNVSAQDIMDHFGFRGVNLGEYVKAKQNIAQIHLNHVYDSFSDLADLLGVPPKAMSLNGTLGVAIGAQGSGKALAHFVPGVNEINITRDSGAGALAHEFGHALDHYFATQQGRATSMAKRPYLSAALPTLTDAGGVRPEIIEAMRFVVRTMDRRPMTEAEAKKYMQDQRELNERRLDRWVDEFKKNRGASPAALSVVAAKLKKGDLGPKDESGIEANLAEFVRAAGFKPGNLTAANAIGVAMRLHHLADEAKFLAEHIPQVDTNYSKASQAMDAKKQGDGYWSTPWEKFARAFETFVMDALADRERESLYLSGLVDSQGWRDWAADTGKAIPYPAGDERLAIQQAFQKLVDTIETRETDQGTEMFSIADEPRFYSELSRQVAASSMNSAPALGWKTFILGLRQKGVKPDEIEWTGVLDWLDLQQGKVPRQAVVDFLSANGVQVTETVLGEPDVTEDFRQQLESLSDEELRDEADNNGVEDAEDMSRARLIQAIMATYDNDISSQMARGAGDTKYQSYTLPGGTNYREVLLTLPDVPRNDRPQSLDSLPPGYEAIFDSQEQPGQQWGVTEPGQMHARPWAGRHADPEAARAAALKKLNAERLAKWRDAAPEYKSGHWDQPNILAHIRLNDRTDAEGRKVLFVEELQSDWQQAARRKGFSGPHKAGDKISVMQNGEMVEVTALKDTDANGLTYAERADGSRFNVNAKDGVPRAPFIDSTDKWVTLALKRVVKMAVDEGYDRVAFVTGEQSAERYDLSKQISKVEFERTSGGIGDAPADLGPGMLYAYDMNGRTVVSQFLGDPNQAEEYVGKEVAKRLLEQRGKPARRGGVGAHVRALEGLDLKVGGEGMRAFYDKIVPATLKPLLKKMGGGELTVAGMRAGTSRVDPTFPQPGFDITPSMREKAAGGLPLFDVDATQQAPDTLTGGQASLADRTAVSALQSALRDTVPGLVLDARPLPNGGAVGQLPSVADRAFAAAGEVARRFFDKRVVLYRANKPFANGVHSGKQPGVIFLSADTSRPAMAVMGHEMLHAMRKDRPDLYNTLNSRLATIMRDADLHGQLLNLKRRAKGWQDLDSDKLREELVADIVGDNFTDPEFWRLMAKDQPSGFRKVADAILKFLDDLIAKITADGKRPFGTDQFLTDVQAARAAVVDAMRNYSGGEVGAVTAEGDVKFSAAERTQSAADGLVSSGQALRFEGGMDGLRSDAELLADLSQRPAFRAQGLGGFDAPTQREMLAAVRRFGLDPQIRRAVVELVTVDVVNILARKNLAPESLFRDEAVLKELLTVNRESSVSAAVDVADALVAAVAGVAAKLTRSGSVFLGARKGGPTANAGVEVHGADPSAIKAIGNRGTYDPADPDIRFSLDSRSEAMERAAGGQKATAQDFVNATGGVFDWNRIGETKQDRVRTVIDKSRPFYLGALTLDQIIDVYGKEIPQLGDYGKMTRAMENERQKAAQEADALYNEWAKLDKDANDRLARVMLDATVYGVHPDRESMPENPTLEQRVAHARLRKQWDALPEDAQAMYRKVRDYHADTLVRLRTALEERLARQVENAEARAATLTSIRMMFDRYLSGGPYFPLHRFGDYLVVARRDDGEKIVASYETAGEQQAAARAMAADGFKVKMKTAKEYSREQDGAAGKFIGDIIKAIDEADFDNGAETKGALLDDLNQLFIRALPDLSFRKHFMHRKGTPGFSADVMRGFANSAFHSASHIARLDFADRMQAELDQIQDTLENVPEGDFNTASQVLNEVTKRHDAILNPKTHPVAALLNQVGFVMYLGASPAAGLVNLLQTPMVTLPYLGARHGFGAASAALTTAAADIMAAPWNKASGKDAAQSSKLTAAEKAMIRALQEEGVIDLTQAADLAAATTLDTGSVARSKYAFAASKAMRIIGWTFHVPEVMNRQATALAAFRLATEKGADAESAADAAREAIRWTQFDYSGSNRARYMQGDVMRVLTQFKQFAQNMTYFLGRALHQALAGETPEVRSIARKQFVATMATTFTMAGTLGLPGVGAAMGLIGMAIGAADDDDEPFDWKKEFRQAASDAFGKEAGEVLAHGIPRALLPVDLAGRVGLGELWFRDSNREGASPREAFAQDIANILGPTFGTALAWYTAADHMSRGNWGKAVEAIVPKAIRDPLKAIRYAEDGVTSYTGEPLMQDLDSAELLGQLLGFTPADVSEMYEGRSAVKNRETALTERRQVLLTRIAQARLSGDTQTAMETAREIQGWNERNPEFRITSEQIARSVRNRAMRRAESDDLGVYLPKNKRSLSEEGRFAAVE